MEAIRQSVPVLGQRRDLRIIRNLGEIGIGGCRELIEIRRILLRRLNRFRLKCGCRKPAIGLPILLDGSDTSQKFGFIIVPPSTVNPSAVSVPVSSILGAIISGPIL